MVFPTRDIPSRVDLNLLEPSERLFVHSKRPKWGIGLWVREDRTRRAIRFQDGELRLFKEGYYHLLEPAEVEDPDRYFSELADEEEMARMDKAFQELAQDRPPVMSLDEQLGVLTELHPEGFAGDSWIHSLRLPAPERRGPTKSHIESAADFAQEALSKDRLEGLKAAEDWTTIHASACAVLKRTSLVSLSRDVRPFEALEPEQHAEVARALCDLLHGEARVLNRFSDWVHALKGVGLDASWALATILPALVHPDTQIFVKHRAMELQARSMLPGTRLRKKPSKRGYRKARRIARATRRNLDKAGMKPADLLDVSLFMWHTLRPKAQEINKAMKKPHVAA